MTATLSVKSFTINLPHEYHHILGPTFEYQIPAEHVVGQLIGNHSADILFIQQFSQWMHEKFQDSGIEIYSKSCEHTPSHVKQSDDHLIYLDDVKEIYISFSKINHLPYDAPGESIVPMAFLEVIKAVGHYSFSMDEKTLSQKSSFRDILLRRDNVVLEYFIKHTIPPGRPRTNLLKSLKEHPVIFREFEYWDLSQLLATANQFITVPKITPSQDLQNNLGLTITLDLIQIARERLDNLKGLDITGDEEDISYQVMRDEITPIIANMVVPQVQNHPARHMLPFELTNNRASHTVIYFSPDYIRINIPPDNTPRPHYLTAFHTLYSRNKILADNPCISGTATFDYKTCKDPSFDEMIDNITHEIAKLEIFLILSLRLKNPEEKHSKFVKAIKKPLFNAKMTHRLTYGDPWDYEEKSRESFNNMLQDTREFTRSILYLN